MKKIDWRKIAFAVALVVSGLGLGQAPLVASGVGAVLEAVSPVEASQ